MSIFYEQQLTTQFSNRSQRIIYSGIVSGKLAADKQENEDD
jgi:hypothetical protein